MNRFQTKQDLLKAQEELNRMHREKNSLSLRVAELVGEVKHANNQIGLQQSAIGLLTRRAQILAAQVNNLLNPASANSANGHVFKINAD